MAKPYTWSDLAVATLPRQLPAGTAHGRDSVVDLVRRVGPIQSQVARAPFVTASSRLPGTTYADVSAAYESGDLLRGSSLRGTVHTSTLDQHVLLDAVTRRALERVWHNALRLERSTPTQCRAAMESFAAGAWRSPDELRAHLQAWLAEHDSPWAAERARTDGQGRAMAHLHSALVRRPVAGGWERQSEPEYRLAADLFGSQRYPAPVPAHEALVRLARQHVTSYGPSSRRDIAWWTGEGLRRVDEALAAFRNELVERPGPNGETYYDLAELADLATCDPDQGLRLLPEFDALVVGYDTRARSRFVDEAHLPWYWSRANGLLSAVVLDGARLRGSWRFDQAAPARRLQVRMFPGEQVLDGFELAQQVRALETVLDITVTEVEVTRAAQ